MDLQRLSQDFIMREDEPRTARREADEQVFPLILLVEREPALELNLEKIPVLVLGDKICSLPVITQPYGGESVISQDSGYLLEIEALLLSGIECRVVDFLEAVKWCAHAE